VFGVPDVSVLKLKIGDPLTITSEALPNEMIRAQISRISPSADPKSRVFDIESTIPNSFGRLKIGMIASLQIGGEPAGNPVPVVPLSAVLRSNRSPSNYGVYVVEDREGRQTARLREVKLGEVFGNMIAAPSGLQPGEQVVVAGATILHDGETVRIIP
jgi:multidrug efflux system membrane fusion protein